ncbi:Actin-like protein [Spraguea lophii 42_110]|uniref:Actin-like protein n=1 Tax=Spraguea lophii (strain 42_110) TaxID=1358809 RepID=S7W5B8_SPRLO|nr:Actin-like protein [Spraguea lophii 42_110]
MQQLSLFSIFSILTNKLLNKFYTTIYAKILLPMFYSDNLNTFVIDIGTETYKIGHAGTELPYIYSSSRRHTNDFISPVTHSLITNLDEYTNIIEENVFYKEKNCNNKEKAIIQTDSEDGVNENNQLLYENVNLLIAENTHESHKTKEKLLEKLMETKKYNSIIFQKSSTLDLFSIGKTTGIVISLSGGSTQVTSIVEGLIQNSKEYKMGGYNITQEYKNIINDIIPRGYTKEQFENIKNSNEQGFLLDEFYKEIKETTLSFDNSFYSYKNNKIEISASKLYSDIYDNIIKMVTEIIDESKIEDNLQILGNVFLCGGNKAKGLLEKLNTDLNNKFMNKIRITDEKTYSTFLGGSILGSLGTFKSLSISYKDYEEHGVSILKRKKLEHVLYSK